MNTPLRTVEPGEARSVPPSVNRHATDMASLVFGLAFVMISTWWLVAQAFDLDLDLPQGGGWLVAAALIIFGVLGVTASLRGGRRARRDGPGAAPGGVMPAPPVTAPTVTPAGSPVTPPAGPDPVGPAESVAAVPTTDEFRTDEFRTDESRTAGSRTDEFGTGTTTARADDADQPDVGADPGARPGVDVDPTDTEPGRPRAAG
jgi:hypothetical protein